MAIDLPPALPPQFVEPGEIRAEAEGGRALQYKRFTIHVSDKAACLNRADLEDAAAAAPTLSDVVRNIARQCYGAGYPSSQLVYARVGDSVFVSAKQRVIARVDMPPEYRGYFGGLEGRALTDNALERRRALASLKADRQGENLRLVYQQSETGDTALRLGRSGRQNVGKITPQFGNLGNRFVGRYIAGLELEQSLTKGFAITAAARTALSGLNSERFQRADSFNEQELGINQVTPIGIFGLRGRFVQFDDLDNPALPFAANIEQGSLSWASVVRSTFADRLTLTAEAERINRETDMRPGSTLVFRELYTALGAAASYERRIPLGGASLALQGSLGASFGLGDDDELLTNADLGYSLVRPSFSVDFGFPNDMHVEFAASAQISSDVLPEQKQWVIGGTETVHAFLPGVSSGDEGYAGRLQFRTQDFNLAGVSLTVRVFAETAQTDSNTDGIDAIRLVDTGVALDWEWTPYLRGLLAYAEPIDDDDLTDAQRAASDANLLFAIAFEMGEW